jgi:hypothetical protein
MAAFAKSWRRGVSVKTRVAAKLVEIGPEWDSALPYRTETTLYVAQSLLRTWAGTNGIGVRKIVPKASRSRPRRFPLSTSALRGGPRSSEDSEMFTHAACLLLRRKVCGALAKPTEPLGCLLASFGWSRTITLEPI